jgi:hypothetical protein
MRSLIKSICVVFTVATLACGTPGAVFAANIVQNGQFTSNTGYGWVGQNFGQGTTSVSVSNWNNAVAPSFGGPALTWLFNGNTPTQSVNFNGTVMGLQGGVTANPGGGNFLALDGDTQYNAKFSQSITGLTVGNTYQLSFDYAGAQQTGFSGPQQVTSYLNVTFGSESQNTQTLVRANSTNGSDGVFTGWSVVTMDFTASAANQTLAFLAIGTPGGLPPIALLGDVSLMDITPEPPAPPVPEPSSIFMTAIGFASLVAVRYRRRMNSTKA